MAGEGEKRGAMEAEKGEVEKRGDVAAALEEGKGVAEAKEVAGGKMVILWSSLPEKKRYDVPEAAARLSVILGHMLDGCANGDDVVLPVASRTLDTVVRVLQQARRGYQVRLRPQPQRRGQCRRRQHGGVREPGGLGPQPRRPPQHGRPLRRHPRRQLPRDQGAPRRRLPEEIKGKTPDEIRATFNITNDFTEEDEEEFREQYSWIFDVE